jgi:hypothetical protein
VTPARDRELEQMSRALAHTPDDEDEEADDGSGRLDGGPGDR